MSQSYSLEVTNNSGEDQTILVYQQIPDMQSVHAVSLAWFSQKINAGNKYTFSWEVDYSFVAGSTGTLHDGNIKFTSTDVVDADLKNKNHIELSFNGDLKFGTPTQGDEEGTMSIHCDGTIPSLQLNDTTQYYAGIAMQGKGTIVRRASPRTNFVFQPKPTYYISFGDLEEGDFVTIERIGDPGQLQFTGKTDIAVSLEKGNTWSGDVK